MGDIVIKRIVVAGSRNYNNYQQAERYINFYIKEIKEIYRLVFLSGGCQGADKLGEKYAEEKGYEIQIIPAEWEKYGLKAGPIRNEKMAQIADYVICFWDGKSRGTENMINSAIKYKKPYRIVKISDDDLLF